MNTTSSNLDRRGGDLPFQEPRARAETCGYREPRLRRGTVSGSTRAQKQLEERRRRAHVGPEQLPGRQPCV